MHHSSCTAVCSGSINSAASSAAFSWYLHATLLTACIYSLISYVSLWTGLAHLYIWPLLHCINALPLLLLLLLLPLQARVFRHD
jgi:hypothetical protein